jgi:predicted GIY-YIG superfamily endonuclease
MPWFVYILKCKNGAFYTGVTNDVEKRVAAHKAGKGAKYTKAFGVARLLYKEELPAKGDALRREAAIKRLSREEKELLVKKRKAGGK